MASVLRERDRGQVGAASGRVPRHPRGASVLRLPPELLRNVGEYSSSSLVVALSSAGSVGLRSAARAGVDATEHAWCGIGLTVVDSVEMKR